MVLLDLRQSLRSHYNIKLGHRSQKQQLFQASSLQDIFTYLGGEAKLRFQKLE